MVTSVSQVRGACDGGFALQRSLRNRSIRPWSISISDGAKWDKTQERAEFAPQVDEAETEQAEAELNDGSS
ncbi:MAG: hypothetical protein DHS20C11_11820 [Lysobacteraceae bacterium]|nr:MAG: hypothetical protein DHS20C11_11820 [Xanthomonadaceae bacterium]